MYTTAEILRIARNLLKAQGVTEDPLAQGHFLDFCELVKVAVLSLKPNQVATFPNFKEFSEAFRKLRDNIAVEAEIDPGAFYRPKHQVALDFHKSNAWIRYFFGGNRISKTISGFMDDYWVVTGQHPYREKPPNPAAVFIIGTNYSNYAPNVFEKKLITGEPGNPLSPLFPKGGRWLYRYDERKHIVYVACRDCAFANRAESCPHPKSTIALFSDVAGPAGLAGAQYAQGHFDEQIQSEFFAEAKQRIKTVPNSGLIITETPLFGKSWWTYSDVYVQGTRTGIENQYPDDPNRKIVSLHSIDQFSAGLVPHDVIEMDIRSMKSESEVRSRIYGEHVAASEMAVFDLAVMDEMRKEIKKSHTYQLVTKEALYDEIKNTSPSPTRRLNIKITKAPEGQVKIWEEPKPLHQYIIGADVAQGLLGRDKSAANVFKLTERGLEINFEQVASFHGWINSHAYAEELFKLGHLYNDALLVVESNGPGDAAIQRLKEFGCWFLFRDVSDPAQAQFTLDSRIGIDTNLRSKGLMISVLQGIVRRRRQQKTTIILRDEDTINQMESYIQEPTKTGASFKFKGEGTANDDLVMATALATYVASSYPIFNPIQYHKQAKEVDRDPRTKAIWEAFHTKVPTTGVEEW